MTAELTAGTRRTGIRVGELVVDARPGDLVLELDPECARIVDGAVLEPVDGVGGATLATAVGGRAVVETESAALVARARLLVAADAMGVLEAVSGMSAEYAKSRVQFGVPIGSFQAVKHRSADTAVDAYACMSLIAYAARRLDRHAADAPFHAASAFLVAVPAATRATAANIQNHGAIGFTLEHPAHLFLRRAHVLEHVLGPAKWVEDDLLGPEAHEFI